MQLYSLYSNAGKNCKPQRPRSLWRLYKDLPKNSEEKTRETKSDKRKQVGRALSLFLRNVSIEDARRWIVSSVGRELLEQTEN